MQWIAIILVTAAIALNYMDRAPRWRSATWKIRQEFGPQRHQPYRRPVGSGLGPDLRHRATAVRVSAGSHRAENPGRHHHDRPGLAAPGGGRGLAGGLFPVDGAFPHRPRRDRGAVLPVAATRSVSDWFDVKDRGVPSGVYTSGAYIGPTIAPPIPTAVMLAFDWRVMFIVMGVAGIFAAGVWFLVYREPRLQKLAAARRGVSAREPGSKVVRFYPAMDPPCSAFCAMWALDAGRFLHRLYHLDVSDLAAGLSGNAATSASPSAGFPGVGAAGSARSSELISGGYVSDWLVRRAGST